MSKADLLGASSSFQRARPVSARRAAINQATNAPTEGVAAPTQLPLTAISLNPDNPRSEPGDLTELASSLRDHGQKTAISIMTRFAYLQANPGRESDLEPDTHYVVVDGNSRLAAARKAGLNTLKVMLDDELGADPEGLLESALVANVHRNDLDPLDEAKALNTLLKIHGSQEKLAARLSKSQGWVSQRLALLKLTPDLQKRLLSGEEQAKHLRAVGNKKPEEQEAHLAKIKAKAEAQKKAEQDARRILRDQKSSVTTQQQDQGPDAQKPTSDAGVSGAGATSHYPVMEQGTGQPLPDVRPPVPDPREEANGARPVASPETASTFRDVSDVDLWADGVFAMDTAIDRLEIGQRSRFIARYMARIGTKERLAAELGQATPKEQREQLAAILQGAAELLRQP